MSRRGELAADVVKGAVAGVIATWLMNQATTWMYEREGEETRRRENEARGDRTAYESAADRAAGLAGLTLSNAQRRQAGAAIHWTTGVAAGALYGAMRRRWPRTASARGLTFGTVFFLLVDELLNPLLGFTPGPAKFPWQAHARGLGGHLTFGMATDLVLEGLDRVA